MRDVHTMGKFMFIVENAIYTYLSIKIYGIYFFVNLFDFDSFTSMTILIVLMVISVIVGVIITINHRRNSLSTGINVTLPLAIYSMLGYFRYVGLFIAMLLFLSALLSVIYIVMTRQYSKSKLSKKNKRFSIKRYCFLGVRTIVTACCSILIVFLFGTTVTGNQLFKPSLDAETTFVDYSKYLFKNMDSVLLLDSGWEKLDNQLKMDVLQKICSIERVKLGINHSIQVRSKAYMNELLACYNPKDNTVYINAKHLEEDTGFDILESCLHECYHSYQYELVNLYNNASDEQKKLAVFASVKNYKDEFTNYKCSDDEYYQQKCEIDARSYARYEVQVYKNIINDSKKKINDYINNYLK